MHSCETTLPHVFVVYNISKIKEDGLSAYKVSSMQGIFSPKEGCAHRAKKIKVQGMSF